MRITPHAIILIGHLREVLIEPKIGAEVGVFEGDTVNGMLREYPGLRMYAVDPWDLGDPKNTTLRRVPSSFLQKTKETFFAKTAWAKDRLTVYNMQSLEGCKRVQDGELDFVFIDGDHRYEAAKEDLNAWWPKLRSGGILFGDDYRNAKRFGVIQAVDEFVAERGLVLQMLSNVQFAIHKIE